jgi:hypothetical protein
MCLLLAPARTEDSRGLANYTGNQPTETFVAVTLAPDAFDTYIRTEVNGISNATMSPPQGDLQRCIAISEKHTGKACTRIGEGQLCSTRHRLLHFADGTAKFVGHSHGMRLRPQFRRQHATQLKLNGLTNTGQFGY